MTLQPFEGACERVSARRCGLRSKVSTCSQSCWGVQRHPRQVVLRRSGSPRGARRSSAPVQNRDRCTNSRSLKIAGQRTIQVPRLRELPQFLDEAVRARRGAKEVRQNPKAGCHFVGKRLGAALKLKLAHKSPPGLNRDPNTVGRRLFGPLTRRLSQGQSAGLGAITDASRVPRERVRGYQLSRPIPHVLRQQPRNPEGTRVSANLKPASSSSSEANARTSMPGTSRNTA